nr:hypothetical protein BN993_06061 [Virgibacillus halodenitrificans]
MPNMQGWVCSAYLDARKVSRRYGEEYEKTASDFEKPGNNL